VVLQSLESRQLLAAAVPTAQEQYMIELINRARRTPPQFAIDYNLAVPLTDASPQPPLAVNPYLTDSARGHAQEMATYNYFAHTSTVTGKAPNQMAREAGYPLPALFANNQNYIESIAAGGFSSYTDALAPLKLLLEDPNTNPPGHRIHLLAIDSFYQQHDEIGVGYGSNPSSNYKNYWAIHTAYDDAAGKFLTGVAISDAIVSDNFYTPGEGLGGVTISARRTSDGAVFTTPTFASGGYSLRLNPGTYDVTASGPGFASPVTVNGIVMGSSNVKRDFEPVADTTRPTVIDAMFQYELFPNRLRFSFSENVSASLSSVDLEVGTSPGGALIPASYIGYEAATNTAIFQLTGTPADGNYVATLKASGVADASGNTLASDYPRPFYVLSGDVNRDGEVSFPDLLAVSTNFGKTPVTFAQGDTNGDGAVDFADLLTISTKFGSRVNGAAAVAAAASENQAVFSTTPLVRPKAATPPMSRITSR
jgi:uncharacterized protein YkwD